MEEEDNNEQYCIFFSNYINSLNFLFILFELCIFFKKNRDRMIFFSNKYCVSFQILVHKKVDVTL